MFQNDVSIDSDNLNNDSMFPDAVVAAAKHIPMGNMNSKPTFALFHKMRFETTEFYGPPIFPKMLPEPFYWSPHRLKISGGDSYFNGPTSLT
ncbi:hypothetical protein ACFL9U_13140 [Thermodesulfobacteriota bacterium]